MENFEMVAIDIKYIKYLHKIDSKVQYHEAYNNLLKPYVGVVLKKMK